MFARIGKTPQANVADRFVQHIQRHGAVPYTEAYKWLHNYFPAGVDMENLLAGAIKSGYVRVQGEGTQMLLVKGKP